MPLLENTLREEILKLTDKQRADFRGFPADIETAANGWSQAARAFFIEAAIPSLAILLPPAHDLGTAAMKQRMITELSINQGLLALQLGFADYAATLAANVIPGVGVIAPPPSLLMLSLLPTTDASAAASSTASAVLAWAKTSTFTPTASAPIPWS